jgi:HIP---CoA ligase
VTETIPRLLRRAGRVFGGKAALDCASDGPVAFDRLDLVADRFAKALLADGMTHGEFVGIWAPNMWEWVAAAVGAQRVGGAIVPINSRLSGAETAEILRRAGVKRLVSIGGHVGKVFPALLRDQKLPDLTRVVVLRANAIVLQDREVAWESFLEQGEPVSDAVLAAREELVTPDTLSDVMFTSGTTGRPKGALFDHKRAIACARVLAEAAGQRFEDVHCCFGPFSHIGGYKNAWVAAVAIGNTVTWPESFKGEFLLELIARYRVSAMAAPPTVWQDILDHPNRADQDLSSLRYLALGGARVPAELVRRMYTELRPERIAVGYGMTESSGIVALSAADDSVDLIAQTVGRPTRDVELRIVATNGENAPTGTAGEILVRCERMFINYLDDPEATRAALTPEGWLRTGDIGALDAAGYLRITDRLKDMFIVGGFNVYPAEIEHKLSAYPGISQCAVIGVPDKRLGEVGHAFVVRSSGASVTEAQIIEWCRMNLATYKVPRGVSFLTELPINATGKVLKFELRGRMLAGGAS